MSKLSTAARRLVLGRPFRSDRLHHQLLPKRIALPVFASDPMSSVAYAPEEIFLVLSVAGLAAYSMAPWIGLAVSIVLLVVIASYRQNVHAYPSGGGDYEVVSTNLGPTAGLTVASALLVDYVLTVAVSISSAASNIGSAVPFVAEHKVAFAITAVLLLTAMNLRGIRESGTAFAIPTYAFLVGMYTMLAWGVFQIYLLGEPLRAESAAFEMEPEHELAGLAMVLLVARAFSSGSAALTGVEAISNGVPAFRKPKSRNAATTLLMLGIIAVSLFMGMIMLARATGVKIAERPEEQLVGAPPDYQQKTLIAQLAETIFQGFPLGLFVITGVTALILVLAANTAFNGFPVLGSILAQDRYLPRQLHTRGDRLAFSNGIWFLAVAAIAFIVAFRAEVTALIHLYIVGVFVSFTLSQIGMVRHWTRLLGVETDPAVRRKMVRSRVINAIGLTATGTVLVVVVVTKFLAGAWIAILAMGGLFVIMKMIRRHYDTVAHELEEQQAAEEGGIVLPSRNHAIVLVSKLHLPTLRALAYARATRPDALEAITVSVDDAETRQLVHKWEESDISVPLKVIASPYREITRPVLDYVKRVSKESPRTVVTVFIPEYVVGHWWEQVLHNQSALRLKGRLLFEPNVMVTSVPWQLSSSERLKTLQPHAAPGDARRGFLD
ncbi:MAG: APC family permease [Mycobacterium sp.]